MHIIIFSDRLSSRLKVLGYTTCYDSEDILQKQGDFV